MSETPEQPRWARRGNAHAWHLFRSVKARISACGMLRLGDGRETTAAPHPGHCCTKCAEVAHAN